MQGQQLKWVSGSDCTCSSYNIRKCVRECVCVCKAWCKNAVWEDTISGARVSSCAGRELSAWHVQSPLNHLLNTVAEGHLTNSAQAVTACSWGLHLGSAILMYTII